MRQIVASKKLQEANSRGEGPAKHKSLKVGNVKAHFKDRKEADVENKESRRGCGGETELGLKHKGPCRCSWYLKSSSQGS